MNITITIHAPELANAILALAAALEASKSDTVTVNHMTKNQSNAKPQREADETKSEAAKETQEAEPIPESAEPVITLETVRTKLASLSQAGKQAQVKELIQKFGASKLTEIPAERYRELLAEAEAIQ